MKKTQNQQTIETSSKLTLEEVFASPESVSYPSFLQDGYIYLTSLAEEKGRSVLQWVRGDESLCITPSPYSLRTKINEYGGKPYWQFEDGLVFANQADQCLYRQLLGDIQTIDAPQRITPKPSDQLTYMYSDVQRLHGDYFVAIIELSDSRKSASENTCFIGLIDASKPNEAPKVLQSGADFYSNLVLDQSRRLAWVQWNHPMMPWDHNQLFYAVIDDGLELSTVTPISVFPEDDAPSFCQLAFDDAGKLLFSVDFTLESSSEAKDYWNVYCYDFSNGVVDALTNQSCEFGYPHWQYGDVRIVKIAEHKLLAIGSDVEGDSLYLINTKTDTAEQVYAEGSTLQNLAADQNGNLLLLETPKDSSKSVVKFSLQDNSLGREVLKQGEDYTYPVSEARAVSYPCQDGGTAHAFYYPPVDHSDAESDETSLDKPQVKGTGNTLQIPPPLLVMVHGGPTARAYRHFDVQKQFWCSNGFAVLDVNHRGSSGYGRQYRDALYGLWGELDTTDIVDGIKWLTEQGLADANKVCIRGKSAGGYAVLRTLTQYPEIFRAGACYYGIGNLATLAEVTHKFEKHYTDRLIDEPFDAESARLPSSNYYKRSPINKIDQIQSDMIIFQGGQDNVVPPAVAHEMTEQLAAQGVVYEYVEYPDEGHGFRNIENNIDAWARELAFYKRALA